MRMTMAESPYAGLPAKRDAITDAARRVFLEHGYTHASVDQIAAEAGVAKQTIYNHFGDKERLFREVMHQTLVATGAGVGPPPGDALADSDDLERDLRAFARFTARGALEPDVAALRRVMIAELDRHPQLLREWGSMGDALRSSVTAAIARQAERGVLDVDDPEVASEQLIMLTVGSALTLTVFGTRELSDAELGRIVDQGIDLWLRAYRAPTARTASRRRRATARKA
jgi:TetR/AcrR family transcriptional regulator, mexJK operon transcriptional repressor